MDRIAKETKERRPCLERIARMRQDLTLELSGRIEGLIHEGRVSAMIGSAEALGLVRQGELEEAPALEEDELEEGGVDAMEDDVEEAGVEAGLGRRRGRMG
jgi:hypothetical protein